MRALTYISGFFVPKIFGRASSCGCTTEKTAQRSRSVAGFVIAAVLLLPGGVFGKNLVAKSPSASDGWVVLRPGVVESEKYGGMVTETRAFGMPALKMQLEWLLNMRRDIELGMDGSEKSFLLQTKAEFLDHRIDALRGLLSKQSRKQSAADGNHLNKSSVQKYFCNQAGVLTGQHSFMLGSPLLGNGALSVTSNTLFASTVGLAPPSSYTYNNTSVTAYASTRVGVAPTTITATTETNLSTSGQRNAALTVGLSVNPPTVSVCRLEARSFASGECHDFAGNASNDFQLISSVMFAGCGHPGFPPPPPPPSS